ncbi:hypothetical protein Avbf_08886 [Armadillidium vulgare]|nr:hypothetical protein Avbf_08886 [Armadillidium vulgare]
MTHIANTIAAWRIVFITAILVYFFANLFYIIFITTDVQPWNDPVVHDSENESEIDSKTVYEDDPKNNSKNNSVGNITESESKSAGKHR